MKKYLFIISVAMLIFSAKAQSKTPSVPSIVQAAFTAKFPNAQLKNWHSINGSYLAKFSDGQKTHVAYFDNRGSWLKTETKFNLLHKLPTAMRQNEIKAGFGPWYIESLVKVEDGSGSQYCMLVDDIVPWDMENRGSMQQYKLTFSPDGQLIKKEKLPHSDN